MLSSTTPRPPVLPKMMPSPPRWRPSTLAGRMHGPCRSRAASATPTPGWRSATTTAARWS